MSDVWKKLNLKGQEVVAVLGAPESFAPAVEALAEVRVLRSLGRARAVPFVLAFVTEKEEIDALAKAVGVRTEGDAVVWFAYPKKSSKRYACDFSRDTGWAALGEAGFEGVRQVAIDEDWSALRFRRVEFIETMRRDAKRALTKRGKQRASGRD